MYTKPLFTIKQSRTAAKEHLLDMLYSYMPQEDREKYFEKDKDEVIEK